MLLSVDSAVQIARLGPKFCVLLECGPEKLPEVQRRAHQLGKTTVDISLLDLDQQKALFQQMRRSPNRYILAKTSHLDIYSRLRSLVLVCATYSAQSELNGLQQEISDITMVTSVRTYVYDLIVQLRYNRFLHSGAPTYLLTMVTVFSKLLAMSDNTTFVTPEIVQRSFRAIIPFQIKDLMIKDHTKEMTMMYGSDAKLVDEVTKVITPTDVILMVLDQVTHV